MFYSCIMFSMFYTFYTEINLSIYLLIQKHFIITMAQLIWTLLHIIRQYEKEMFNQTKNWLKMISVAGLLYHVYIIRCDCDCVCTSAGSIVLCKYWERSIHKCTPAFDWPDDMLQETWLFTNRCRTSLLLG